MAPSPESTGSGSFRMGFCTCCGIRSSRSRAKSARRFLLGIAAKPFAAQLRESDSHVRETLDCLAADGNGIVIAIEPFANADLEFPCLALLGLRQPGTRGPLLCPGKVLGRHELSGPTELGPVDSVPIDGLTPEPNLATDRLERIPRDQSPVAEFFDLAAEVVEVREFLPFRPLDIGLDRFVDHRHGEDLERVLPRSPAAVLPRASQATYSARDSGRVPGADRCSTTLTYETGFPYRSIYRSES